ncbi:hypothetical protein pipiens_018071, partial [Culex pipiens pipiens]
MKKKFGSKDNTIGGGLTPIGNRFSGLRDSRSSQQPAQPYHPWPEEPSSVISERCTRARINSAIFVSSEGRGFDSIEFIRRYGSQSVLCRKARSAENVSASERQ